MRQKREERVLAPKPANEARSDSIAADIRSRAGADRRVVFVSGNFNVVHPGHLRLLQFAAECGEFLVVGVNAKSSGITVPADMRLDGVRAIGIVSYAFLLDERPETFIATLKPEIVVKGKEFEDRFNSEKAAVDSYGGHLMFGSGEVRFSSLDLLNKELFETNFSAIQKPEDYPKRHGFKVWELGSLLRKFRGMRVMVVGDLIVDEYITCDPLGMSQEDPTIVVTPLKEDRFVGGAGIVAAHATGLGAEVSYFGVVGNDATAKFAQETLSSFHVKTRLLVDDSRPTTLKKRYRANGKTLLRVSHLRQHDISRELVEELSAEVTAAVRNCDLLVFSDFNYGCLPQSVVDQIVPHCKDRGVMMVADSQASSQLGDVSRFQGMRLLAPTEYEARLATRDFTSGLVVLAEQLRAKAGAEQLFVTLGAEGLLIHAPTVDGLGYRTDQLPAFNQAPKDVAGAGDSLLTCASMSLAAGADIWKSAYLGSIAAACQVGRVGNFPLTADELATELSI
jgi:rfaE bifunctional protein kinase chain/domain